jgi:hypothetical protein
MSAPVPGRGSSVTWAAVVVLLYLLLLVFLTIPVLLVYAFERSPFLITANPFEMLAKLREAGTNPAAVSGPSWDEIKDVLEVYELAGYWVWLGILGLCQALLLVVPVRMVGGRPRARRKLFWAVLTAAFLFGNLVFASGFSGLMLLFGDKALDWFGSGMAFLAFWLGGTLLLWAFWGWVFAGFARQSENDDAFMTRITRWLLRGSVLELLVAVPSHVIVRGRDDCCAPVATFWGIATGLSVMLLAFGPGVYFLFVERWRRLRPRQAAGPAATADPEAPPDTR